MFVVKRNGQQQNVNFNKISNRIQGLCVNLDTHFVDVGLVTQKVVQGLCHGIRTTDLDTLAAEICASMITVHHDYGLLAARLTISNLHKETHAQFVEVVRDLHAHSIVSDSLLDATLKHAPVLEQAICHERDYRLQYFGLKTLERSYLLRRGDRIVERPQYMFMRVALQIHGDHIEKVLETYDLMSRHYFIHATPTLFNAGTREPQLSSCFLMRMRGDTIQDIYATITQTAVISKYAGGLGVAVHDIPRLVPMLRVLNDTARYVEQGHNKRYGSMAIYLEPWHFEILEFLNLKKNTGNEEDRARDLFYALWIPDLFMRRVQADAVWSLMNPAESRGLSKCWGVAFDDLYETYERGGVFAKQMPARTLWRAILEAQMETGTPFVLYKDACNAKSNQSHLGTIECGNLCTEIVEYADGDEMAVCNLASIALNKFVSDRTFQFASLKEIAKIVTYNLNNVIDVNFYPLKEAELSNRRHRPVGLGVQGLADTFMLLRYPFDSAEARQLNVQIFETIYYGALEASCELAEKHGPHASFAQSPAARGLLQYDLWRVEPSALWDWSRLKSRIARYGLRNSLLVAVMPTASTAQILGNHESVEAYTNNLYTRRVLSGEFQIINPYLLEDLIARNLWTRALKQRIMADHGSIQGIDEIPADLKALYRTAWEIPQRSIIDMAADRSPFIDQSQSLNIYMENPNYAKLSSMHFYGWSKGLKTGMYYLRSKGAATAIQFTVEKECLQCSA